MVAGVGCSGSADGMLFLCWHVPLMYRVAAGQDEEFYGVPGIMVRREGIPRIPYMPSRDPNSIGYQADVALFTLPPLGFYFQGLIHLIFGDGLGQARLASTVAGLASVGLVAVLGVFWLEDRLGALLAAGVYLFCRPFQFAATTARPDMLAAALGLGAVVCGEFFVRKRERRWAAAAGFLVGLSLLSHPFGVVPALQVGLQAAVCWGKGAGLSRLVVRGMRTGWLRALATVDLALSHAVLGSVWHERAGEGGPGAGEDLDDALGDPGVSRRPALGVLDAAAGAGISAGDWLRGLGWASFGAVSRAVLSRECRAFADDSAAGTASGGGVLRVSGCVCEYRGGGAGGCGGEVA